MKMVSVLERLKVIGEKKEKAGQTFEYCVRILGHFSTLEAEDYDEEELSQRIALKIQSNYFGAI